MQSNLPLAAQKAALHSVDVAFGDNKTIGFVTTKLNGGQMPFIMINQINDYLSNHHDVDLHLYADPRQMPILTPICSVFNYIESSVYRGNIIACDPAAINVAINAKQAKPFYYAYDPLLLNLLSKDAITFLYDQKIPCITRNKEHKELLSSVGFIVQKTFVPDFEIDKLLEAISE